MSLFSTAERLAALDRSKVILDDSRCLHTRDKFSQCRACFDICPVQAITPGKPPVLISERCQTCLACLPSCPTGAYIADDAVPTLLNCAGRLENNGIELVCERHPAAEQGFHPDFVGVRMRGCLAGLGVGAYIILAALGFEKTILRTDGCSECVWNSLRPEIHSQAERAQQLLSVYGKSDTVTCMDEIKSPAGRVLWDANNPPLSRRDLFRILARQGQLAIVRAMEHSSASPDRKPGRDRLRVLAAVSHLPSAHNITATHSIKGLSFAALDISDACTACGACGRVCPTDALRFRKDEADTAFSISFLARNCIDCELCEHVCLPDAITLNDLPVFKDIFESNEPAIVRSGQLLRCERCGTLMAQRHDTDLCSLCEYRRIHPFGSLLPKKLVKESRS